MTKYAVVIVKRGPFFQTIRARSPFQLQRSCCFCYAHQSCYTFKRSTFHTTFHWFHCDDCLLLVIHFYSKMSVVYTPLQTMAYPFHTMKFLFEIHVVTAVILLPVILSVSFDVHHWTCTRVCIIHINAMEFHQVPNTIEKMGY